MTGALMLLTLLAPKWVPTFDQSFDGPPGQAPDPKVWSRDVGPARNNNELEDYTDGNANAFLDGKGHLVIEARREEKEGRHYTSARLKTEGSFAQRYGKMEARMMLPEGQGIWPAFWMLGANIQKVGWPACGETDIVEYIGKKPTTVYGTLHSPGHSGGDGIQGKIESDSLSTRFHDYGVEWSPEKIVWTFDGKPYHTVEAKDVGGKPWPFEKPQFLILNLAVGGGWPGNPDSTTVFPQRLVVDYVRVWKDANLKVDDAALAKAEEDRRSYHDAGPQRIPGIVKLSDYVDAHDSDDINEGGAYRKDHGVDIGEAGPAEAPYSIGWTKPGEWLTYDVNVLDSGRFKTAILVASQGPGGKMAIDLDGKPALSPFAIPDTGGWTTWKPLDLGSLGLPAGKHKLTLRMVEGNAKGSVGNVAYLKLSR